jgi:hypothetical protein
MVDGVPPADSPDDEDPEQWKRELLSLSERIAQGVETLQSGGVIFCKHMAKHSFLYDFNNEYTMDDVELIHRHILLIRDPVDVLSSWSVAGGVHGDNPTSDEVGIIPLMVIYSKLESRMDGMQPVVLDSDDLVSDPEGALFWVCERLSIPFHQSMLTWESGKHKCDGPWARVSFKTKPCELLMDSTITGSSLPSHEHFESFLYVFLPFNHYVYLKVVVHECPQIGWLGKYDKRVLSRNSKISYHGPFADAGIESCFPCVLILVTIDDVVPATWSSTEQSVRGSEE